MNIHATRELQPLSPGRSTEQLEFELLWYWRVIYRRKWAILLIVALVGVLSAMYASTLPPIYRSTATVMVQESRKKVVSNEELYDATVGTSRDYYATQFEVMKSRTYAERLVRVMNLTSHPEFDPRQPHQPWYAGWVPEQFLPSPAPVKISEEDLNDIVTRRVMGQLSFQPVRNTQIVKISFDANDPSLAERVPNTLAYIYIVAELEARSETTRMAMEFLVKQSESLKKKLNESEQQLQEFRDRQKIVVTKGATVSGAVRKVEDLTASLADARRKRIDAETIYNAVVAAQKSRAGDALESIAAVQNQPALMRVRDMEAEAQRKVKDLAQRYGAEHPRMIAAQAELRVAHENTVRQLALVVQTLAKDYEVAKANEASIDQALNAAKTDAQQFNRAEFTLARLEREVENDRQIYNQFMQRYRDIGAGDIQAPIARVVDLATKPLGPSGPNRRQIVVIPMLIALALAAALALLLERLDNTVRTGEEVESKLEAKTVGVLQRARSKSGGRLERLVLDDNRGTFSEAIRTVRSDVMLSSIDSRHKTVLVTSAVPDEGKTTVACNLALSFAQVKKTLLIEADMRRPRLARIFGNDWPTTGLSDLMSEGASPEQCIHAVEGSSLFVLPTGRVPLAPLEFLASKRFAEVMELLQETYDVIILDTPPVHLFSDALVLSNYATSVLFVVKADATPYQVSRNCLVRLARANAQVLGVVLNQLDLEKVEKYYRSYGHYYYEGRPAEPAAKAGAEVSS